jgi:hypothetical protein
MKIGYSLLIDEYVDVNLVELPDCDALRISCPVCLSRLVLDAHPDTSVFRHASIPDAKRQTQCELRAKKFTANYCNLHNTRARRKRLEFLQRFMFKELLGGDPSAHYEKHVMEVLSSLQSKGALSWLPSWHWEFLIDTSRAHPQDSIAFAIRAEEYLRKKDSEFPHVPESGYRRQVHIQVAFDLMQYLLTQEGGSDDYQWLFVHAFRICLGKWVGASRLGSEVEIESDPETKERVAAARILASCALDLISDDEKVVEKAIEILNEVWTGPPIMSERIPFLMFLAAEVAGEMQTTLYRLPYLPLFEKYVRPCQPRSN